MRRLLPCLSLVAACGGEPVVYRGQFVEVRASPGLTVCAGTGPYLDGFVPFLRDELGLAGSDLDGITYTWIAPDDALPGRCEETRHCGWRRKAFAHEAASLHALTHAVMGRVERNSMPYFEEGLAYAYDPSRFAVAGDPLEAPGGALPAMAASGLVAREWGVDDGLSGLHARTAGDVPPEEAGRFTTLLLSHHGPAPFLEFYSAVPRRPTDRALRRAFERAYGVDLFLEHNATVSSPPPACTERTFTVRPYACAAPELAPVSEGRWLVARTIDCAVDEDVVGGISAGDEYAFATHTVFIDKAGDYLLHVSGDADMLATFGSCDDCLSSGSDLLLFARGSQRTTLAEGTHFVQLAGPAASAGQISISVERLGPPSQ
jgi:hypothetical protein